MTFHSVLGQHRDRDRPRLRSLVALHLERRPKSLGTDPVSVAKRQREIWLTAQKALAAMMIHGKQGQNPNAF